MGEFLNEMNPEQLFHKFTRVIKEEGAAAALGRVLHFAGNREGRRQRREDIHKARISRGKVLFINGYCSEHPIRYRVLHPMEQLCLAGVSCAKVYFEDIEPEMEENFEIFVFYRCECTEEIEAFIRLAKEHQKAVFFDIDDLVIDTKYTDQIPFVQEYPPETKKIFDQIVNRTRKTLTLCDAAITTTEDLARELETVVPKAYINRNVASEEMVSCAEAAYRNHNNKRKDDSVRLGYFSGSLTHNQDFEVIRPALMAIFDKYPQVRLILAGELDISDELIRKYSSRIERHETTDWRKLPERIVQADINLAPLEDTIFNRCKSEIKWIEAALVRVPTVASKVGAFETMIEDGKTGVLVENTAEGWENGLSELIEDEEKRREIGETAYQYVMENCTTAATGEKVKTLFESVAGG